MLCWAGLWEAAGADTALDPALLPALCGTEALFGMSTQSNKTGAGQSKSKQEAPGQINQGSHGWCRNPEGSSGTGENRNEDSSSSMGRKAKGAMVSGAVLSSLSWRAPRHWRKIKAGTCPSTFLLSFLRLCTSPQIMQHQGAQKWEQHQGLLWHIHPLLYILLPSGQAPREPLQSWESQLGCAQGRAPEQADQGNPFFLERESQEEARAGTLHL